MLGQLERLHVDPDSSLIGLRAATSVTLRALDVVVAGDLNSPNDSNNNNNNNSNTTNDRAASLRRVPPISAKSATLRTVGTVRIDTMRALHSSNALLDVDVDDSDEPSGRLSPRSVRLRAITLSGMVVCLFVFACNELMLCCCVR
jgi:endonuclease/exonuclease/phosphatase family metal-dependent hydrolase